MTTLESRLREHIDALSPPIELDDALHPSDSHEERGDDGGNWPLKVAATTLLLVGLAATIALLVDRPESEPVAQPPISATASTAPTAAVATSIIPVLTIEFVAPAGVTVDEIGNRLERSIDTIDADDFVRAAEEAIAGSVFRTDGIDSPEGLLAAGTYDIAEDATAAGVAAQMVQRMNAIGVQLDIATSGAALGPRRTRP